MFKLVAQAFETLSDPEKRAHYDRFGFQSAQQGYSNQNDYSEQYTNRGGRRNNFHDISHAFDIFNSFFNDMDDHFGSHFDRNSGNAFGQQGTRIHDPFNDPFFSGGFMDMRSMMSRHHNAMESMMSMHHSSMPTTSSSMASFSSSSRSSHAGHNGITGTSTSTQTFISADGTKTTKKQITTTYGDGRTETRVEENVEHGGNNGKTLRINNVNRNYNDNVTSNKIEFRNDEPYNPRRNINRK